MVEFAMVVWVFLLLMFGAVSAALHSLQREVAETAASIGVQQAASADPLHPNQPNLAAALQPTRGLLQPAMFGTNMPSGGPPPPLAAMGARFRRSSTRTSPC